jgi:hypothetical protein
MPALTVVRRGRLAGAVIPAVALGIAGIVAAQIGAQAASRAPALHAGPKVSLGTTANVFANAFTEAPDGAVFYSSGSVVYVVKGNSRPRIAVRAGRSVIALAANASGLFVETGLTVTQYRRSNGRQVRHWTLTSPFTPITSANLYAVGGTLWSWTDWGTDSSGLEYATVSRIATAHSAVHVVSKFAYPVTAAADSAGLYFQSTTKNSEPNFLDLASPSGAVSSRQVAAASGTELAVADGRVDLLVFGGSSVTVNSYSGTTLRLLSSKHVSGGDYAIAGTGFGLVVLACHGSKCSAPAISELDAATGSASGGVSVPGAAVLLSGPDAVVIEVSHGSHGAMTLQRISS